MTFKKWMAGVGVVFMSTVNPHYTFQYSQPLEYRFSHDSVFLARQVFERFNDKDISNFKCLDLCSGCGIIGLDFLFHSQNEGASSPRLFDFLEVQEEVYRPHFEANVQNIDINRTSVRFIGGNYKDLTEDQFSNQYDLILCNPPYFHLGQGTLSPSEFKNRCRFFLDASFQDLFIGILASLKVGGHAYVLLRDQAQHGWSPLDEVKRLLGASAFVTVLDEIRGTGVVLLEKTKDL